MDMGSVLVAAEVDHWFVPPHVKEFNATAHCFGECTSEVRISRDLMKILS